MAPPALEVLLAPSRVALALLANLFPRRYRLAWDGTLPIVATGGWSALATVFVAFAVGLPAFLRYATRAGSAVTDTMLSTATAVNQGQAAMEKMGESYIVSMLSLPAFLLFTPIGLVTLYIGATGLVRCLAFAAGEARGDPLLAGLDSAGRAVAGRWNAHRATSAREALEGPEVPDVLLPGPEAGAPEAPLALLASRRKADWTEGTFVLDGDARYRIGRPFDRQSDDGLRTVYPLLEVAQAEVMRRIVRHALPAARPGDK